MIRQCPNCQASITRSEWLQFYTRSSVSGGRLVRPCGKCGELLWLSPVVYLTTLGGIGLFISFFCAFVLGWPDGQIGEWAFLGVMVSGSLAPVRLVPKRLQV